MSWATRFELLELDARSPSGNRVFLFVLVCTSTSVERVPVGVAQRIPLGKRVDDEFDRIQAGTRKIDSPLPLGVGHRGADLVAVGIGDDERDAFEEDLLALLVLRLQRAADRSPTRLVAAIVVLLGEGRATGGGHRQEGHDGPEEKAEPRGAVRRFQVGVTHGAVL